MEPQHIDSMKWREAPAWATHIIGWVGEPQTCYWAEEIDGRYFSAETRQNRAVSFGLVDEDDVDDDFGWEVMAMRPNNQIQRAP